MAKRRRAVLKTEAANIFIEIFNLFGEAFNVAKTARQSKGIVSGISPSDYRMGCELTLLYFLMSLGISGDQINDEDMRFLRDYAGICKNLPRQITDLTLKVPDGDVVRDRRSEHNHIFTNFVSFAGVIEADIVQVEHPSPREFSKNIYDLIFRAGRIFFVLEGSSTSENKLTHYMNMLKAYVN